MASAAQVQPRRGQFEQRLDDLLTELSKVSNNIGNFNTGSATSLNRGGDNGSPGEKAFQPPPHHRHKINNNLSNSYTDSAPAVMLNNNNNSAKNATRAARRAIMCSSPPETFVVTSNNDISSGNNHNNNYDPSSSSSSSQQTSPGRGNKHYCSQIISGNNTNKPRQINLRSAPVLSGQAVPSQVKNKAPPTVVTNNNNNNGEASQSDEQILVLSPPSSSGDNDSNKNNSAYRVVNTKIVTGQQQKSSQPPADNNNSKVTIGRIAQNRRISANSGTSREDTCDSTKYNSDSDTSATMSRGSPASGSNSDFLTRLEQTAAKQPGSIPLPFSYLAMGNNTNSSPTNNLMSSSFHRNSPLTSSQHQSTSGYYGGANNNNIRGYDLSGGDDYEDDNQQSSYGLQQMPVTSQPPPPPPPLPRPGQQRQRVAQPSQNNIIYSPTSQSQSGGSSYSPHATASNLTSPTSSSTPYFPPGPGGAVFSHAQYNSPMGLYSNENAAEAFRRQTGGVVTNVTGLPGGKPPAPGSSSQDFQSTPLFKLIQEEETRQQRRMAFHRQGGYKKQYSADDEGMAGGGYPFENNAPPPSNGAGGFGSNRRITTMTMPRQRPGSSMAQLTLPTAGNTPKEYYDQVLATLPRRPNRWSANTDRGNNGGGGGADNAEIARQAALRARCSSATRCMMTGSPTSGVDEGAAIDDRQIRYRGAKIPSRTFQLLHAYTEYTAKDDIDRVVQSKNDETLPPSEPIATVVISDGSSSRPRIRQRPAAEMHSRRKQQSADGDRDPSEFQRGAIQGDGPPRPAVPSRSFLALQAVLDNQEKLAIAINTENANKEDSGPKDEVIVETPAAGGNAEGGDTAKSLSKSEPQEGEQNNNNGEASNGDTNNNEQAKIQANGEDEQADANKTAEENHQEASNNDSLTITTPQQINYSYCGPSANVSANKELPRQFNGIIRQPAQQRPQPLKVSIAPTRIRPSVPRAPTWDRRPFRHEVTSMRTPVSKVHPPSHPDYSNNNFNNVGPGGGYYTVQPVSFNGAESAPESSYAASNSNIDEPYRLAKLKVMTGNNKGPTTAPRTITLHQVTQQHQHPRNGGGTASNNNFAHFGEATDF